jgi:hypothetical protein
MMFKMQLRRALVLTAGKAAFRDATLEFRGQLAPPLADPQSFASWTRLLLRKDLWWWTTSQSLSAMKLN